MPGNAAPIAGAAFLHKAVWISPIRGRLVFPNPGRNKLLLLICTVLTSCISIDERSIRPGVFDLSTPANGFINSEQRARIILGMRARELCPHGFDRLSESRIVDARALETMIWRVACRA